jgi:hypothetical protein
MVLIAGEAGIPENTVNLTYLWILRGKFGGLSRFESAPALFSLFAKNLVAGHSRSASPAMQLGGG